MFDIEGMKVTAKAFEDRFSGFGSAGTEPDLTVQVKAKVTGDVFEMLRVSAEAEDMCAIKSSHLDEDGLLHNPTGPAVEFYTEEPNWYYLHGIQVPEKLIERPDELTKEDFINETNAEIRRIMVEHVGSDKFASLQDLEVVDKKEMNGQEVILLRGKEMDNVARAKIQFVEVKCNSTGRVYNIGVPPTIDNALEALAWTFEMSADEYKPKVET